MSEMQKEGLAGYQIDLEEVERLVTATAGSALVLYGLKKRSLIGFGLAALGGVLVYSRLSGSRLFNQAIAKGREALLPAAGEDQANRIRIEKEITIKKSPEELFTYWRKSENLPKFIGYLQEVREKNGHEAQWVAKGTSSGPLLEWWVEITDEKPNESIDWRAVENGEVHNVGSVKFENGNEGESTVRLCIEFDPTGSILGAALSRLFGSEPGRQIEEDLKRFKALMEDESASAAA